MVIQTLTTNYNKVYGEKPLRTLIWHGRKHLSVFSTALCNSHEVSWSCNSQADLSPKCGPGSLESEGGWDTSGSISGGLRVGGAGRKPRTVHGVWVFGCQEEVGSKPKDREWKGRRKKGSEHICWELFLKRLLLLILLTLWLRKLRSGKVRLHCLNNKTEIWKWNLWFLAWIATYLSLPPFLSLSPSISLSYFYLETIALYKDLVFSSLLPCARIT